PAALRGTDGRTGQVLVETSARTDDDRAAVAERVHAVAAAADAADPALRSYVGGAETVNEALNTQITGDLARAESVAVPVTFVLLLLVFGGVVAAGLPFLVALGSVVGSFFLVWLVSLTTDVSVFALNLITGLGLGLGIDYALLVVTRYREELRDGHEPDAAVARTVATAGRTVLFSGATVMVVLAAMTFFPQYFLRSFGYAGIAATGMAVLAALTALPATLALLGRRVDRWRIVRRDLAPSDVGAWSRIATAVMRRPVAVLTVVVAGLLVLASPVLSVSFSQPDQRILPADHPVAVAAQVMSQRFTGQEGNPVDVVLPGGTSAGAVTSYAQTLSRLPHVATVTTPTDVLVDGAVRASNRDPSTYTAGADVRVRVVGDVDPRTRAGRELVSDVRAVPAPVSGRLVGGVAAQFADSQSAIGRAGRWALVWVAAATLLLLFAFTGSVVIPVKAVLLNVFSLMATLGTLVWIFQDGHLRWLVGDFTVTGSVDTSMAVLIAVTAFALSMDYEVFLISRIAEEHRRGSDTQTSVVLGLQRSGRIITAAAVLLAVVFASFVSSGVTNIKQLGFGVAFAILLDATVVRGLLVPALMRLMGRANWWAPAPLVALHRRIGVREE
ncbi:MAG: MMPL family transporter, partial [Actinomycetota bacterium]